MYGPDPLEKYPMAGFPQVGYLKNFITKENIIVGDYTYYDDLDGVENFENKNILYHYPFLGDKLIIGKFCAIATGVKFIMNGANHKISGFSTYPFSIFGNSWEKVIPKLEELPYKGDTIVGNDVWIGYNATIMPGIKIGNGSIIGANSNVTKDIPAYSIVGGNPAKIIRKRFDDDIIEKLEKLSWWDWSAEKITQNLEYIVGNDLKKLLGL
ncbi:Vat family streptogramin A O-acetyltransferase [Candidatus Gracilibacteria bacterium]|nr:Vat family streptogramin A O-acetyltransferase [Candidatus Gracilibacteria bacterium]NUJ99170.1 Vat family streptogramin A O-acetyltransferase [Candidatus Gracilibacteria bacterium]